VARATPERGYAVSGRLVLVRHGQSHGNVDRRLDTRPPGAALTDLGHEQARAFAKAWPHPVGMVAHSVALRATETAAEIGAELVLPTLRLEGIHEVQVGDLENRNDDAAVDEFNAIYRRWQEGDLDLAMPGGESATQVLERYLPVVKELRLRFLDDHDWTGDVVVVSHGAAIRLAGAVLAGVDGGFALEHHLANAECVVLAPITDGRWSCVQWASLTPPFEPERAQTEDAAQDADPMG
jgi:broad specificity phosphatase PhoE